MVNVYTMTLQEKMKALSMMLGSDAKVQADSPEGVTFVADCYFETLELLGALIVDLAKVKVEDLKSHAEEHG